MKLIRRIHLYLGCFFAPLLVFYVATGWYQTVNPDRRKGVADSNDFISRLNRVHGEQFSPRDGRGCYDLPVSRAGGRDGDCPGDDGGFGGGARVSHPSQQMAGLGFARLGGRSADRSSLAGAEAWPAKEERSAERPPR